MAYAPTTGPVIDEPLRPRVLWYWIGAALIVGSTVGAVVWLVSGLTGLDDRVDGFERVPGSEGGTITIDDPGDYVVYAEGTPTPETAPPVEVTGPDDEPVDVAPYAASLTYDFGGRSGSAQQTFTAADAGEYTLETSASGFDGVESYAVGESIGGDLVAVILGTFAIGGLGFVLGVIVLIVTAVRRARARRARTPSMPQPPSSWGQAPATWGPSPHTQQTGWGGRSSGPSSGRGPAAPPPPAGTAPPPPPGWPPA